MKFGIVNRQTSGYFCYQGWPTVELSNGDLFTTYYQRVPGDDHPSVLYTRWTLPETK